MKNIKKAALSFIFFFLFLFSIGPIAANAANIPNLNIIINTPGNGASYIKLDWNELSNSGNFYVIERKINTEDFKAISGYINTAVNSSSGDILLGVSLGSVCTYRIAVYDSTYKFIAYSNAVSFILAESSVPSNFTAKSLDPKKISLTWDYNQGTPIATIIERAVVGDNTWIQIGGTTGSTNYFEDNTIQPGISYKYRIKSILGANCYSSYVETSAVQTQLSKPADLNASLIFLQNKQQALIEWQNTWSQEVNIVLERKEDNKDFQTIFTAYNNEGIYLDNNVTAGSTYTYRIKAIGKYTGFVSPYSEEFSIIIIDLQAPTGLSALATSSTTAELSWQDNSNNETGYEIWRSNGDGTPWQKYAVLPANTRSFTDTNLSPATTYTYKIRAFSSIANVHSYFTPEVTLKTIVPDSNIVLEYTINQSNVPTITWHTVGNVKDGTVFQLERRGEFDINWLKLPAFSSISNSFTDTVLTPYTRYSYRMKIIDTINNSTAYSNTIEFAPGIPLSPANLSVSALGSNTAKLTWDDKSMNEDGFVIERYADGIGYVQIAKVPVGQKYYIDNLLSPGKIYYYKVAAYNKSGISGYTEEKYFVSKTPSVFYDMADSSWALEAVLNLADTGIITGTSQGYFSPGNNITRAEFTSMVVKALKLKKSSASNFIDIKPSDWYYEDILTARAYGIVSGSNDYFNPDSPITREDAAVILCKALEAINKPLAGKDSAILDNYSDRTSISDYAVSFLSSMRAEGLMNGKDGNRLAPKDFLSRAEAAAIIWRVISNKAL